MSRFIIKAKELIAAQLKGKLTQEKITNENLALFLFSLFQATSKEKIDENDLIRCEQQKNHITFLVNFFMSETYEDIEEEGKIKMIKKLMNLKDADGLNIPKFFNEIKPKSTDETMLLRNNIISIIKSKPNININIMKVDNNNNYNEDYFYDMISSGKTLIKAFIEKHKIKQVFTYNQNIFDEILVNHQSFNVKCLFSLNDYLENFDKIYKIYNNFNSVFKQIEKINNILISQKIMDDDGKKNIQKYIENIYSGFEKGSSDINLSFDKKIKKLSDSLKKLEANSNGKIKELEKELNYAKKKIKELESESKTAKGTIKELESESKSSKRTIKELTENLENEQKHSSNLEKRVEKLENLFEKLEEDIECPISLQTFKEPMVTPSGNSYEKKEIKEWIDREKTDPKSGSPLNENQLYPNLCLKNIIEKYNDINEKIDSK